MTNQLILTNFNVPPETRSRFDEICRISGRTRTSVLVELMNQYVLSRTPLLIQQVEDLKGLDRVLRETRRVQGHKIAAHIASDW